MKQLVLTGLGNEMDLKTGKSIFTAIFNNSVRIEISKEAAETLTAVIYSEPADDKPVFTQQEYEEARQEVKKEREEEEGETFGGDMIAGSPILRDEPASVYDDDTGVEQV